MLPEIETLLRQKIGLDADSIGKSAIARAVRQRMADCGLADARTYLARLQIFTQEMDELIENIIVPETWFFRDREPFNFLSRYAMSEWLPANPGGVLRVLSVPCSTGEEPYSIAIALIEAGLASKNFRIDAVDISKKSLLKAQRALYDKNSFRGENPGLPYGQGYPLREQYFVQTERGYQLCEWVQRTVNFIHGNLLEPHVWFDKNYYDAIFCRNLLIYLDEAARKQTLQILDRLLNQNGLLFVGHSETGQFLTSKFVSVRHPLAFAYRKLATERYKERHVKEDLSREKPDKIFTTSPNLKKKESNERAKIDKPSFTAIPPKKEDEKKVQSLSHSRASTLLETARSLADGGRLDEAAALCETYLRQNRVSAEAYVLLGEVRIAAGNDTLAEECFAKAIYLEPDRYEALVHLALLKEQRGDLAGAALIRQRIQRLQKV